MNFVFETAVVEVKCNVRPVAADWIIVVIFVVLQ
jgi:hypothetical protein